MFLPKAAFVVEIDTLTHRTFAGGLSMSSIERDAAALSDFRIFHVNTNSQTSTLSDATVRNGRAVGVAFSFDAQGGLLDRSASVLSNCTFTNNYAFDGGGALSWWLCSSGSVAH